MKYMYPVKVIATQGNVENVEGLLQEKSLQIGLNEPNICVMKGKAYVILDFGKELSGGARILTRYAEGNRTVRLRFGESVGETCAELKNGEAGYGATNDHSLRDFSLPLVHYSDMTLDRKSVV